jgi:hypothetical protein
MTAIALRALLLEHAAGLEGVEVVPVDDDLELRLDGDPFAAISGGVTELCLRPVVAGAALRTPDTAPSPRGTGWVRFEPPVLDEFARDRAVAWLESAWRFADEGGVEARPIS